MYRLFTLGLALGLFVPVAVTCQDKKTGATDLNIAGKLAENDPRDKVTANPHKVHEYKMKGQAIYVIDLKSKDFDPALRLADSTGRQLAFNDDAAERETNARIVFNADRDGTYQLVATSSDGKAGAYTLTVRPGNEDELKQAAKIAIEPEPFYALTGKPAAEILGEFSINGETKKLSDLKGKVVLLDFWAVWCGPCIRTFPHLRKWDNDFKKDGLEIVGVTTYYEVVGFDRETGMLKAVGKENKDTKKLEGTLTPAQEHDMLKDFITYHKLTHRMITTTKANYEKTAKDYAVSGIPQAVIIDRQGFIRMIRVGSGESNAADLQEEIRFLIGQK